MSYEIQGYLYKKFDTVNKTDSFKVRDFVIKTEGEYPQFVKIQLSQDKCQLIDEIHEGWKVKAFFNIKGNEWQDKFFITLAAWKVTVEGRTTSTGGVHPGYGNSPSNVEDAQVVDDEPTPF